MNKKGLRNDVLILLILSLVILMIIGSFAYAFNLFASRESNVEIVQAWVGQKVNSKLTLGGKWPPVRELDKPLIIKNPKDLRYNGNEPPKFYREIADSMYDCWRAFDKGESDFIGSVSGITDYVKNVKKEIFCYPCRAISFSNEIKNDVPEVQGFLRYLNEYKPIEGEDKLTYLQYLANDDTYTLSNEDLENDKFATDKDLYVMLFAASGRAWNQIAWELLGVQSGELQEAQGYSPKNINEGSEGQITSTNTNSGVGNLAASGVTAGVTASRKIIANKITSKLAEEGVVGLSETAVNFIQGEGQAVEFGASRLTAKSVTKAAGRTIAKGFAKTLGAKFIPYIGWSLALYESGTGVYRLVFNPKPFVATVMIVEPKDFLTKCNGPNIEQINENIQSDVEKFKEAQSETFTPGRKF